MTCSHGHVLHCGRKLSVPGRYAPVNLTPANLQAYILRLIEDGNPHAVEWFQQLWGKQAAHITLALAREMAETGTVPPELARYIQDTMRAFVEGQLRHLVDTTYEGVVSSVADYNGWDLGSVEWTRDLKWRQDRLPVELTDTQLDGLRLGVEFYTQTYPVPSGAFADRIRTFVGLTERESGALANATAAWTEGGLTPSQVSQFADQYSEALRIARAQRIGRTEQAFAAHEGNMGGIQEAIDQGLIENAVVKVWNAANENTCEICDALDGVEVPWGDSFPDGAEPPVHPNCMCVIDVVELTRRY